MSMAVQECVDGKTELGNFRFVGKYRIDLGLRISDENNFLTKMMTKHLLKIFHRGFSGI